MVTPTRKSPRRKAKSKKQGASPLKASPKKAIPAPPPASNDTLRTLYATLLRCLSAQEEMADRTAMSGAGPRQALAVATIANLADGDTLAASIEDIAAMLAKGVSAKKLTSKSSADGNVANPVIPADPFIAGTGVALAHKLEGKGNVALAICPQAKPALEQWDGALRAAAAQKLPIVFVIENGVAAAVSGNGDNPHLKRFSFFTRDYGFPAIVVDGDDLVAVWRVAQEAIHRARNGAGPTLIDCRTAGQNALAHMEHYLKARHAWNEGWKQQLESEIRAKLHNQQA